MQLLILFDTQLASNHSISLDRFLKMYFHNHRAIGSNDRKYITDVVYGIMRWKGLLDYLIMQTTNREKRTSITWSDRYALYQQFSPNALLNHEEIPYHVRVSFPKWLFTRLERCFTHPMTMSLCAASNGRAPLSIRANGLKTSREKLLEELRKEYDAFPCAHAPFGITLSKHSYLHSLASYKTGLFEVQDEGSQLIAELVNISPKESFLDYCAGAGGKSLAIAPKMQGKGQLLLCDIRPQRLLQAKKRLQRAGVQNVQFQSPQMLKKGAWTSKVDWVLVDAPCSGTGTLRRNPERKWWLTPEIIEGCIQQQRKIFNAAFAFVKPGGHIVYATCSLLPEENAEQAAWLEKHFPMERTGVSFSSLPRPGEMDGFFGIVWKKKRG